MIRYGLRFKSGSQLLFAYWECLGYIRTPAALHLDRLTRTA